VFINLVFSKINWQKMTPRLSSIFQYAPGDIAQLKTRLDHFYHDVADYSAFSTPSDQVHCWTHIADRIRELSALGRQVRVLELGAGRSGFGGFLSSQNLREECFWTAQDVTNQNSEWLETNADNFILGDIETTVIDEPQDIVFSTYVLEHVVNPAEHLNCLARIVDLSHGTIFIFCPRYDLPGYMTPSSKHLSKHTKLSFMLTSALARIETILTGQPSFLVQNDLAAFYQPFFTDADAVHWVSLFDLRSWALTKKGNFRTLKIGNPKVFSKDWIVKRMLTIGVSVEFGSK
jgi:2-polyprenyl-3-methyl-5-hydroxy-6-metoxy-1,4-benzoquinol methylase